MKSKVLDIGDGRYTIFKNGEILCKRNSKRSYGFFRKKEISKKGYWVVHFKVNHKRIVRQMHRLLACAFIPNPENKPTVNHKDGNKLNNELSNLEYMSMIDNLRHAAELGLMSTSFKLNTIIIRKIREEYSKGKVKQYELARKYNVDQALISRIVNMKIWRKD